jgi:hypothetical protein
MSLSNFFNFFIFFDFSMEKSRIGEKIKLFLFFQFSSQKNSIILYEFCILFDSSLLELCAAVFHTRLSNFLRKKVEKIKIIIFFSDS